MSGYELQQFVMVSPEVWQDLHLRYTQRLWPWWLLFLLLNALVLVKSRRILFFTYVVFCWVFLGVYYFMHYVQQVHTFAFAMACVFVVQGLALLYLKVLRPQPKDGNSYFWLRHIALFFYGVTAFVPLSYVLENSKDSVLLFGWGAEQTSIGTMALVLFSIRSKVELLLICIPLAWISFYVLSL